MYYARRHGKGEKVPLSAGPSRDELFKFELTPETISEIIGPRTKLVLSDSDIYYVLFRPRIYTV